MGLLAGVAQSPQNHLPAAGRLVPRGAAPGLEQISLQLIAKSTTFETNCMLFRKMCDGGGDG